MNDEMLAYLPNAKTVTIGELSRVQARQLLHEAGITIGRWGNGDVLELIPFEEEVRTIDYGTLAVRDIEEMSARGHATWLEVFAAAESFELLKAPAEIIVHVCLNEPDIKVPGGGLPMFMEPIATVTVSERPDKMVFGLERLNGNLKLRGLYHRPRNTAFSWQRAVFARNSK